jgi:hypothetical protein
MSEMRRLVVPAVLLAMLTGMATASPGSPPRIRFLSADPVKARGTGFYASERVRVTLRWADVKRVRSVVTTRWGSFSVSFGALAGFDRCTDALWVTAVGRRGDQARGKLPQPECPPALAP